MTAIINGTSYRIEFSYRRREGKRATLARNSPIEGVSCCAVVCDSAWRHVVSVAAVVCSAGDPWSRREGRRRAFERAVGDCEILRKERLEFFEWFYRRFPPAEQRPQKPKVRIPLEEISRRKEEGRARKAEARSHAN